MAKVLLIEDDKDITASMNLLFHAHGHQLQCESNGEKGLKSAFALPPDLIIVDMMLPGIDGAEVCRSLRKNELTASVPLILFTAVPTMLGFRFSDEDKVWIPANKIIDKSAGNQALLEACNDLLQVKNHQA